MPSMYMENAVLEITQDGMRTVAGALFDLICDATPTPKVLSMRLFQNDIIPSCNTLAGDLEVATFTGYANFTIDTPCTDKIQAPGQDVDGNWIIPIDQHEWAASGSAVANTIYGVYILEATAGADTLFALARFPTPLTFDETGDTLKMTGAIIFRCGGGGLV